MRCHDSHREPQSPVREAKKLHQIVIALKLCSYAMVSTNHNFINIHLFTIITLPITCSAPMANSETTAT